MTAFGNEEIWDTIQKVFTEEYNLEVEIEHLIKRGQQEIATHIEQLVSGLTLIPPDWNAAERNAEAISFGASALDPSLEHFRHDLLRSLLPLLWHLPDDLETMKIAMLEPLSPGAQAMAAARIARIFANEFASV